MGMEVREEVREEVRAEDAADMAALMEEEAATTAGDRDLPMVEAPHLEEEKTPAKAQPDNYDNRGGQFGVSEQGPCHRYHCQVEKYITPKCGLQVLHHIQSRRDNDPDDSRIDPFQRTIDRRVFL